ncbi:hypothetical protein LP421_18615 [Rhizobium sp. RCAM05350]|nr:hypothetical protein LP421_18615 [Rhizobium sp. RCAM05350]
MAKRRRIPCDDDVTGLLIDAEVMDTLPTEHKISQNSPELCPKLSPQSAAAVKSVPRNLADLANP